MDTDMEMSLRDRHNLLPKQLSWSVYLISMVLKLGTAKRELGLKKSGEKGEGGEIGRCGQYNTASCCYLGGTGTLGVALEKMI